MYDSLRKEKIIEENMIRAIEEQEFVVYLQPKIALENRKIVGAEALVRWKSHELGLIPPDRFIPTFEKNGFIIDLDFYVYEKVCQLIRRWIDQDYILLPISVNVSRMHVRNTNFVARFIELIERYQIPPNLIELEITENIFFENAELIIETVNQLKEYGFMVSIDDFGSGYSSLNLLKELPVDVLKLDKEFFRKGDLRKEDEIIVSSVVDMAKKLKMTVLSEGVETNKQSEFLKEVHCDLAQGFLFSKPVTIYDFEKMLGE